MRPAFKIKDIALMTIFSLLGAIAVVVALVVCLPKALAPSDLVAQVMPEWTQLIAPENDAIYFRAFIISACFFQIMLFFFWGRRLKSFNLIWISFISVATGSLITTMAYFIFKNIPYPTNDLLNQIFPFFADMIQPEREMSFYALFVASSAICQCALMWFSRRRLITKTGTIKDRYDFKKPFVKFNWIDTAIIVFIFFMLYIPDCRYALACIFLGDQAQHFDSFVGGPAWAAVSGNILDVDTVSHYGIGLPVLIGHVAQLFGGGHLGILQVMMLANAAYFILWYVLLKGWFKSPVLALAATACAIRLQMFNTNEFPCVFNYPSASVMRFAWDILFFWAIWLFLHESQRLRYLLFSAMIAGIAIFYMSSTGLCLVLTFAAFLFSCVVFKKLLRPNFGALAGAVLVLVMTTAMCLYLTQGQHIFDPMYWKRAGDFNKYFLNGFGALPITQALEVKKYWAFFMGLLIPLTYMWTLVYQGARVWFKKAGKEGIFVCVLSIYGLGLYHYFVSRSSPYGFYTVAVPWVVIVFFWINQIVIKQKAIVHLTLAALALVMLWNHPQCAAYPNVFKYVRYDLSKGVGVLPLPAGGHYFNHTVAHTARIPVPNSLGSFDEGLVTEDDFKNPEALKSYFNQAFDFSDDAKLIDSLTAPKEQVALLSSFDVPILMQAKRRPFFYCYPTFLSRPLSMHAMAVPEIYTLDQLRRTITQLEEQKPAYVFMERIYSQQNIIFANSTHALQLLLLYIHEHYKPVAVGKYLMAMKRG